SQFRNPSFLTLSQGDGVLYVSDSANHAIRRILPGQAGRVETIAGSGTAGFRDGTATTAQFNNPQGIAIDNRGYLWVADTGNQVIRRINLASGAVQTVAGHPGASGFNDATGDAARFSSPVGIAVESESPLAQLNRARLGQPPPPTRVIVADSGNGV